MADTVLDQIVGNLRSSGSIYFPQQPEVTAVRVVGHTPKPDHFIYEIVVDFAEGSERVNAKIYRGKNSPQEQARKEAQNLQYAHQAAEKRELGGIPRPIGDFAEAGRGGQHQGQWPSLAKHHYEVGAVAGLGQPRLVKNSGRAGGRLAAAIS